jgi:type I restriction enzyme, S subunit
MNATLESIAHALFKTWFVDFDPVKAKAEGCKPEGVDDVTAALFPSNFTDSALGYIPLGWKVTSLADICENIFSGGTPSTQIANYWNGNIPWLSSGETRNHFIIDTEKTITEEGVANSSTRLARHGSIVIAGAGQGHTRGQTSLLMLDSYINQSVVALKANPEILSDFFLFFDLTRRYEEFRQLSDSHSSRGSLTTKLLSGVKVVLPPVELIQKFDDVARPVVAKIIANLHHSRTLANQRDIMLPRLISGELWVGDVSETVEALAL